MADPRRIYPLDISEFARPNPNEAEGKRRALNWLKSRVTADEGADWSAARTVNDMLAEPRLPENPDHGTLQAMTLAHTRRRGGSQLIGMGDAAEIYRELRAHLTKPKTIDFQYWRVEYAVKEGGRWVPAHSSVLYEDKADAEQIAGNKRESRDTAFVEVTGPFIRKVPAD